MSAADPSLLANDAPDAATYQEGVRACLPVLFGIAAWGAVVGVAMVKGGLSTGQAVGMTLIVYAGSAQLAALPLMMAGAPHWVIFLSALAVNLRFVIMSALTAPHFKHRPWPQRILLGFLTGDMTVAMFLARFPDEAPAPGKLSYLKGLIYPNWLAWQAGSVLGVLLGSQIPNAWGLDFAGTLAILCLLVPMSMTAPGLVGVVVASIVAIAGAGLPYKMGLLAAMLIGMGAAMAAEELGVKWKATK